MDAVAEPVITVQPSRSLRPILALFDRGGASDPAARLTFPGVLPGVVLVLQANRGGIVVTDGRVGVAGACYGIVQRDGSFVPGSRKTPAERLAVLTFLEALAADPRGYIASVGRRHGFCCLCGHGLKTDTSTLAGYGPKCARKWGLPWGN